MHGVQKREYCLNKKE